jgi:hypothetical protein
VRRTGTYIFLKPAIVVCRALAGAQHECGQVSLNEEKIQFWRIPVLGSEVAKRRGFHDSHRGEGVNCSGWGRTAYIEKGVPEEQHIESFNGKLRSVFLLLRETHVVIEQ